MYYPRVPAIFPSAPPTERSVLRGQYTWQHLQRMRDGVSEERRKDSEEERGTLEESQDRKSRTFNKRAERANLKRVHRTLLDSR